MAITNRDQWLAAKFNAQDVRIVKTTARTAVAAQWFSVFDLAGVPAGGVLAGTDTASGVVPTDATAGCVPIDAFGAGNTGYIDAVEYGWTAAGRLRICDMVWKGGAYAFNANVTLSAQPSYAARMPGGDYRNTQIWIEAVTAFTGNLSVAVTYTNQDGVTGRTTGTVATGAALTVGRMMQLPLQAGDSGVQKIESVVGSVATAGTFNVLVLRPLWTGRSMLAGGGGIDGIEKIDAPIVFADSALVLLCGPDSTSTGVPDVAVKVING